MDPFKVEALNGARMTVRNIGDLPGFTFSEPGLGESAPPVETPWGFQALVVESLGTKNRVADAMYNMTGAQYYGQIAQDTVAMCVNDLATVGARPIMLVMLLMVGSSDWFKNHERSQALIQGWQRSSGSARCVWTGGETPTLPGMIYPEIAILAGAADGIIMPKERLILPDKIQAGDVIVLVESSGIHANGLSLARRIAEELPEGYLAKMEDGRTYGETLLDPTDIYVPLIQSCLAIGVPIHYVTNMTGHGWLKLMRPLQPWTYVIEQLPTAQNIFNVLQRHGEIQDRDAYTTFNMGAGLGIYVPGAYANDVIKVAQSVGLRAFIAGHIESSTERRVVILPKGLEYTEADLALR